MTTLETMLRAVVLSTAIVVLAALLGVLVPELKHL